MPITRDSTIRSLSFRECELLATTLPRGDSDHKERTSPKRIAVRDRSKLIETFLRHREALLRHVARRHGDADEAADIVQDTYIRLAEAQSDADVTGHDAYVYRVAGNLAIDRGRRAVRQSTVHGDATEGAYVADPCPGPETIAIDRDRLRQLDAALAMLPPRVRTALLLFRVDGLSHAEIARRLGVSPSMVAKYLAQALRHCRDHLRLLDTE